MLEVKDDRLFGKVDNDSQKESFNKWGGRGCHSFAPVLGGDGTKITPPGDLFDQPPGERVEFEASLRTM